MAGYIATSKKTDWNTPGYLLDYCREVIGDNFDLDPCSNTGSLVNARRNIMLPEDGLQESWINQTLFINPPFGRDKTRGTSIKNWVEKVSWSYGLSSGMSRIFLLIPAAVDTRVWQDIIFNDVQGNSDGRSASVCFIRGRITFVGAEAACPMPMAMIYYARNLEKFYNVFNKIGFVI